MSVNEDNSDLKSVLADIQKRLANLETKFVDSNETNGQQESKNDATTEQTINTENDEQDESGNAGKPTHVNMNK